MTDEQKRTLAHVTERYERQVMLKSRGHVKTAKEWNRYQDAVADFYGYRRWLDKRARKQAAV